MARSVVIDILARDNASATLSRVGASADLAAARFSRAGDKMIATSRSLTRHLTLPILAISAAAVKMSTDFNAAMTRIQTQAGGSARDVAVLSKQVLALAKSAQQGPVELANSLYHLKSVGMSNVAAMKALKQASDLAAVGHAGLEETTNALAGAWRTGIKGATSFHQAVASLNAIIGAGNMKMEDLNAALGTGILPAAKTFGLSLKDVGSALALMTDEGVPADAAATRLRMTFSLMGAPAKQAAKALGAIGLDSHEAGKRVSATEKLLKKAGVTTTQLGADMRKPNGLILAIGDLKRHLDAAGLSATEQSALLSRAFGGGRSSAAILSLINNYEVLRKKQVQVTKLMGKFDESVAAQRATPEAKFKLLESSLQRSMILLGNQLLPLVVKVADKLASMAEKFNSLSSGWRKFIAYGALAVAALGPVLAIGGRLVKVFGLLWRVASAPNRWIAGQAAAQRSLQATATTATRAGSAVQASSAKMSVAALRVEASQLSQQAAVKRSAALFAVAESEKARAAVIAAEEIANAARAAGGAEAVLAERAATDARLFAAAKLAESEAAVKAAATITTASMQATRALGRAQAAQVGFYARNRGKIGMGLGLGLAVGGQALGSAIGGRAGAVASDAGNGAFIGSFLGPEGALAGAGIGAAIGGFGKGQGIGSTSGFNNVSKLTIIAGAVTGALKQLPPALAKSIAGMKAFSDAFKAGDVNKARALARGILAEAAAARVAVREQQALAANTDRYGNVAKGTVRSIIAQTLALSGVGAAAQKYKVSAGELTTAVSGTNDQYDRMRKLLADSGASAQFLRGLDRIRIGFVQGTGGAVLMQRQISTLQQRINSIKQGYVPNLKVGTSAADSAIKSLQDQIAALQGQLDAINGTNIVITTTYQQSAQSANIASLLGQLQTGAISQAQFNKAYHGAGGKNGSSSTKVNVSGGGSSSGGTSGGGTSGGGSSGGGSTKAPFDTSAIGTAIGNIGSAGNTKPIDLAAVGITRIQKQIQHAWAVLSAAQAKGLSRSAAASFAAEIRSLSVEAQKQLRALRVKIRTSDLSAIRTALRGTVDDTRNAFTQMFSDLRAIGDGAINSVLRTGEQRLIALQAKMTNARDYQSGVRSTLAGTFDATKYGSVQDLLGGLAGQTSQNKAYTSEVNKLRREAKGNKGLLAFINQLAASGQTATLQTLAGASKGQLAQVAKAVGGYNESLTKGSQAAELAKFGESVKQMTKEQGHLVHVMAEILHSVLAHPLQAHISKNEIDAEMARLLNELKNQLQAGRKSG